MDRINEIANDYNHYFGNETPINEDTSSNADYDNKEEIYRRKDQLTLRLIEAEKKLNKLLTEAPYQMNAPVNTARSGWQEAGDAISAAIPAIGAVRGAGNKLMGAPLTTNVQDKKVDTGWFDSDEDIAQKYFDQYKSTIVMPMLAEIEAIRTELDAIIAML